MVISTDYRSVNPSVAFTNDGIFLEEILLNLFDLLPRQEYGNYSLVSKQWKRISRDISLIKTLEDVSAIFPKLRIIDEKIWSKYFDIEKLGLCFDVCTLNPRAVYIALERIFRGQKPFTKTFFKRSPTKNPGLIENGKVTLILVPALPQSPGSLRKMGKSIVYELDEHRLDEIEPVKNARWVLLTDPISHTLGMSRRACRSLVKKMGYELPSTYVLVLNEMIRMKRPQDIQSTARRRIFATYAPKQIVEFNETQKDFYFFINPQWRFDDKVWAQGMLQL